MNTRIGIDMGSVSVKVVQMDGNSISRAAYRRHHGNPVDTLVAILSDLDGWEGIPTAFTGSCSRTAAFIAGGKPVNEVVALAGAIPQCCPGVYSVIEMGGQDSKLLLFRKAAEGIVFDDFSMNSVCAAGTGSFLDQQASRLELKPEELGELALQCDNPPKNCRQMQCFREIRHDPSAADRNTCDTYCRRTLLRSCPKLQKLNSFRKGLPPPCSICWRSCS